jgi:tetratricopeptide (TPR) repeat protein/nucleoside phosphorylase
VLGHLRDVQEVTHPEGTVYEWGTFTGRGRIWRVAVAEIGMGGPKAASETERAISFFHAQIALFVGVAGGLKDVKLGDVVASTKVYAYEAGKAAKKFEVRPVVWPSSYALEQRARSVARKGEWLARPDDTSPHLIPHAYIGALAAGEKVLGSMQSSLYTLLKANYSDSLGVEMEGHGFLAAVHANHTVHGLVIRGISDLIDDKPTADAAGWQEIAAQHAAAFAFQVLATFTLPTSNSTLSPPVWNVPYLRNPHFTGRDELLEQLDQQLSPGAQEHRPVTRRAALTQPKAIKGLGGIGKTQIAVEYAYRCREQGCYTHTLWVNAVSEEAVITSFVALAELFPDDFSAKNETNQRKLVEAIKHWLEQCQEPWLLIFDNADDPSSVQEYFPKLGNGGILLTTRADAVGSLATSIEVETMSFIEGTHLLLRRAQLFEHASDEQINEAGNIVVALDHFPLALDQAGAYIEETKCGLNRYLEVYQDHRQAFLARRGKQAMNYPDSVATTWSLSFQKVEQASPAAAELLRLCAYLSPDRIPEELIKDSAAYWPLPLQQAAADPFMFNQMIAELLKFSLVKRLVEERMLSIHRLVQAVQLDMMEPAVQSQWAERVVRAVNDVFPGNAQDVANWQKCLRYLEQVQACDSLIRQYTIAFVEAGDLLNRTGLYLADHASYTMAEPLYQQAFSIYEQQLGPEHPSAATSLNNLAVLYDRQGKYEHAEPLYARFLAISTKAYGTEHLSVATGLNNLAQLYGSQGKYMEAERLHMRALAIREQLLGSQHPTTISSVNNLAILYRDQGKYAQVEPLFVYILAIREQQLGSQHPHTANSLNNLGHLYFLQKKYEQAEPLFTRALAIREQHLGAKHPDTAQSLNNLAALYRAQGKYEAAELLYKRALAIREQHLGAKHPDTAQSLNNLAMLYAQLGNYEHAESLYRRTLSIWVQQLGVDHPHTQTAHKNYAHLLRTMGRDAEAALLEMDQVMPS